MQHFKSRTVRKAPLQSSQKWHRACLSYINYHLTGEVSIMFCCRLCSTHYTAVQIKNCLNSTSAIKIATMKNTDYFRYEGEAIMCYHQITVSKDEWDTKEDTGKSMKNALYVLRYAKRHLLGQSDVEQ